MNTQEAFVLCFECYDSNQKEIRDVSINYSPGLRHHALSVLEREQNALLNLIRDFTYVLGLRYTNQIAIGLVMQITNIRANQQSRISLRSLNPLANRSAPAA